MDDYHDYHARCGQPPYILHYADENLVAGKYRDQTCWVLVWSRKNVLALTARGRVVVPRRQLRRTIS